MNLPSTSLASTFCPVQSGCRLRRQYHITVKCRIGCRMADLACSSSVGASRLLFNGFGILHNLGKFPRLVAISASSTDQCGWLIVPARRSILEAEWFRSRRCLARITIESLAFLVAETSFIHSEASPEQQLGSRYHTEWAAVEQYDLVHHCVPLQFSLESSLRSAGRLTSSTSMRYASVSR